MLGLVAKGQSNAEIAGVLFVSQATVKTHVSRLLTKLGARDRAQLVVVAYETGAARPGVGCSQRALRHGRLKWPGHEDRQRGRSEAQRSWPVRPDSAEDGELRAAT